jgi:predicted dehydrogenase
MRYGIVGLGWAARAFHAPALKASNSIELIGGADTSPQQRAAWERETDSRSFETLDELLASKPDVVVVATPPDSHADLCLQALNAGAHVVCEKPFVQTLEEADSVLAAAARMGRQVAVNLEFREMPIFKAVIDRVGSPDTGRIVFCQLWQLMDLAPWDEKVAWRAALPDRTLFEGGVHLVDLLLLIYGEKPTAVFARRSSGLEPGRSADAIHLVLFEFSGGRLAQLTIDRLCKAGDRYVELRADCEHASLRASFGGRAVVQIGAKRAERTGIRVDLGFGGSAWIERGPTRKPIARSRRNPAMHATKALAERIRVAFEQNLEPPSSGREARDVLEVVEAAYRSAATGLRVELA